MNSLNSPSKDAKFFSIEADQKTRKAFELEPLTLNNNKQMRRMIRSLPVTPSAALALYSIISHFQEEGTANPSIETIRKDSKLKSRSGTKKMLSRLVQEGYLLIQHNFEINQDTSSYKQTTNGYTLTKLLESSLEKEFVFDELKALKKKEKLALKKQKKEASNAVKEKKDEWLIYEEKHNELKNKIKTKGTLIVQMKQTESPETENENSPKVEGQSSNINKRKHSILTEQQIEKNKNIESNYETKQKNKSDTQATRETTTPLAELEISENKATTKPLSEIELINQQNRAYQNDTQWLKELNQPFGGFTNQAEEKIAKEKDKKIQEQNMRAWKEFKQAAAFVKERRPYPPNFLADQIEHLSESIRMTPDESQGFHFQSALNQESLSTQKHINLLILHDGLRSKTRNKPQDSIDSWEKYNKFKARPPYPPGSIHKDLLEKLSKKEKEKPSLPIL